MPASRINTLPTFRRAENGAVAMTFGLMFMMLVLMVGAALDTGRMLHSESRLTAAADAAALAAGKALLDGRYTDAEIVQLATDYFRTNFVEKEGFGDVSSFSVKIDRKINSVTIDLVASVPMTIMKIARVDQINLPISSVVVFDQKDIELSLALDITGSMCAPCSKLEALKSATNELLDIMLPDAGTPNKVRIAFAPFSSGVEAGSLARVATNNRSPNGCTFERAGTTPLGDQAPGVGNFLKVPADLAYRDARGNIVTPTCPTTSPVVSLTADNRVLRGALTSYRAEGTTAGHMGVQWAWYLVSEYWAGVLGAESAPAAYHDGKTVKAVVYMTDGKNNTLGGRNWGDNSGQARQSDEMVREMCKTMRQDRSILMFTVGFQLDNPTSEKLLKDCAGDTTRAFTAANKKELHDAFIQIALQLNKLRISQ